MRVWLLLTLFLWQFVILINGQPCYPAIDKTKFKTCLSKDTKTKCEAEDGCKWRRCCYAATKAVKGKCGELETQDPTTCYATGSKLKKKKGDSSPCVWDCDKELIALQTTGYILSVMPDPIPKLKKNKNGGVDRPPFDKEEYEREYEKVYKKIGAMKNTEYLDNIRMVHVDELGVRNDILMNSKTFNDRFAFENQKEKIIKKKPTRRRLNKGTRRRLPFDPTVFTVAGAAAGQAPFTSTGLIRANTFAMAGPAWGHCVGTVIHNISPPGPGVTMSSTWIITGGHCCRNDALGIPKGPRFQFSWSCNTDVAGCNWELDGEPELYYPEYVGQMINRHEATDWCIIRFGGNANGGTAPATSRIRYDNAFSRRENLFMSTYWTPDMVPPNRGRGGNDRRKRFARVAGVSDRNYPSVYQLQREYTAAGQSGSAFFEDGPQPRNIRAVLSRLGGIGNTNDMLCKITQPKFALIVQWINNWIDNNVGPTPANYHIPSNVIGGRGTAGAGKQQYYNQYYDQYYDDDDEYDNYDQDNHHQDVHVLDHDDYNGFWKTSQFQFVTFTIIICISIALFCCAAAGGAIGYLFWSLLNKRKENNLISH